MWVGDHTSSVIRPASVGRGGASAAAVLAAAAAGGPVALSSRVVLGDEGGDVEPELEVVMGTGRLLETLRTSGTGLTSRAGSACGTLEHGILRTV